MLIPKSYGFGAFNDLGVMIAEVQTGEREVGDAGLYFGASVVQNMSPIYFEVWAGRTTQQKMPTL